METLRYAEVLPNPGKALSQLFTYQVPERLRASITVGSQVLIPFGPRLVVGLVAGLSNVTTREDLKEIEAVLEDVPALSADALPLARWIADYYLCELGDALRPFFAEGMSYRIGRRFRRTEDEPPPELLEHPDAAELLRHLESAQKEVSFATLRRLLPRDRLRKALRLLRSRQAIVERALVLPPRARDRQVRMLEISASPDEIERYIKERAAQAPARVACLRASLDACPTTATELAELVGVSPATVQALVKEKLLRAHWKPRRRMPWEKIALRSAAPPTLTADQRQAVEAINDSIAAEEHRSFLLFGVTGSGKTEVFLHAIDHVLKAGRQAIVLMPEISLTAQAVGIYRARFGDRVALLHSALSMGERWDEWQRIRTGDAAVIIGARSALFAPVRSLGLIVLDEEHEPSYKQDQAPRYHAREVALKRGRLNHCPVVLASATPAIETFHEALQGRRVLLRLPTRIDSRPMPRVKVVDLRGRRTPIFSPPLHQAIAARLRNREQAILFLNRRGFATFLLCPLCGESIRCSDCGVSLKYSRESRQVRCHHCNQTHSAPDICTRCGGQQIRFSGFGTERVERELSRLFPRARLVRMDRDTTARKGSHLNIVGHFQAAEADILIGTQMVAKGFDFPGVTLVGVISADTALNLPDFRAAERTFQLLTQVSGRAGRGEIEGEVVVQTFRPKDYAIQAASLHDYEGFYQVELEARRELNYPPFSRLINIIATDEREDEAQRLSRSLTDLLNESASETFTILGPAPAPLARLRGRYRWHLVVKMNENSAQTKLSEALSRLTSTERGKLTIDIDPVSLM